MKCKVCREPAVIDIRRHNANFCGDHFLKLVRDQTQKAIWKLDWEDHLSTALARAKTERRPVLFIYVTNITGPSNFGSGHC